jgi:hypothetical protein
MIAPRPPQNLTRQRTEERARALSNAVVQAFTDKLRSEIHKHGGFLGIRHVDELESQFQAKAKQLSSLFAQAFDEAAREQEELRWFSIKRPAFDRLIVKRFEQLFMYKDAHGEIHGCISRRLLPGFFLALNMMVGPETMEAYQRRSDEAVARVMGGVLPINWDLVDQDDAIHDVLLDAQYTIAQYFEDPHRRFAWFIQIANAHLAPALNAHGFDSTWELGHRSLHLLINSLLGDLKAAVDDDQAWQRLAKRHTGADRLKLDIILERLTQHD